MSKICLCESHFGEGKIFEITNELKTDISNVWNYAPFDYYKGAYNSGDTTVELKNIFSADSSVKIKINEIHIEKNSDSPNTVTVELISKIDQDVKVSLDCQQSDDNFAAGDYKTAELKKDVPQTVELTFGGWSNFNYRIYIKADSTIVEITVNP